MQRADIEAIIAARAQQPGALLPILHALQDRFGHVPQAALAPIAAALNLSRAEVHGVLSFYPHFRRAPPGRHVLQLCRAEACQAVGARALAVHVQAMLGCAFGQTSADGRFTLEPAYCLGNCAAGPSLMVDERLVGRVDAARFDALLAELARDEAHP
jgi:formate dehydrogenase subunit gamma